MRTSVSTFCLFVLVALMFCNTSSSQAQMGFTIDRAQREEITVSLNGKEVAIFHSGLALDKSYIHPLRSPDGRVITYDSPADHLHHRALCVGWPDISGEDFWAELNSPQGHRGKMIPAGMETRTLPDGSAQIREESIWVRQNGEPLVREQCVWTFLVPQGNLQLVDVDLTLTALAPEVVFGSDKEKPREYHGFTLRNGPFEDIRVFNSNGEESADECRGKAAKWCAISGIQAGRPALAAILDHPSNESHPTRFYVLEKGMQYISSSPNMGKPKVLKAGEQWHLRYEAVAAGKPAEGESWDVEKIWQEFAKR
ncbi:MAG TPA: PmoA family protein [bacterium]|nr:PmoA family protein [bacterium]HPO09893.1 PmoA family protein [bacterium]HQO35408.1 PmoA family protein [bacterium]HQP97127.1 PmoA family protein [bacterium]